MKSNFHFFKYSFLMLAGGLILAFVIGAWDTSSAQLGVLGTRGIYSGLEATFITFVLAALEISLSFDNAIINASVLRNMTPLWRKRFLTWGMWVAVFLMRLLFPLAIVSIIAWVPPWTAFRIAIFEPEHYAGIMGLAHFPVAVFGGTFLTLVASQFFFNSEREGIWIRRLEQPLARLGRFKFAYLVFTCLIVLLFSLFVSPEMRLRFFISAFGATLAYLFVHGLSSKLAHPDSPVESESSAAEAPFENSKSVHHTSAAMFVYLEVLDASFSFDGVVGAFAITNQLLIITIGLSIGAMFVRSLTIMLVEKRSLIDYIFLEAGAFYAIGLLGFILFVGLFHPIPETVTGLSGLLIVAFAWYTSQLHNRRNNRGHQQS